MKISLRAARVNAGYTAREVAEKLGMLSHQMISHYECGDSEPSICTALKMCEIYDVSVYEIDWIESRRNRRGNPRSNKPKE